PGAPGAPADPGGGGGEGATPAGPNQASDVGVTETTLRIGTIVAENGVLGDTFAPAATGLRAWVEPVNAQGGIGGRTLELFTCDDREDRARVLECARQLVEQDQVFALIATNTRALGGAAQYLHDQGIPVLGNPINNSFYRFDNFFSVYGSPYPRNNQVAGFDGQLASYTTVPRFLREELGASRAAVFSYDVAESAQAGDFMQGGLEREGFTVDRYVVSFAAPSFDAPVAEMQRNGTTVILDAMDEGANRRLCDAMERRGFTVNAKVSTIVVMGDSLGENFGPACRPVTYILGDSIPYTDTSVPFIASYREAMGQYQRGQELHQWGLEAWVMGQMLQDYLVAAGPAPTRQGFMAALNALDGASPAGIMTPTIRYSGPPASAATVPDCIGASRWDDAAGGWVPAAPFPYCIPDAQQFFTPVAEQGT
ncbi:MAG TPA: ABC transporter substrate-binding protein, partial [Acidimicrobiales bacterium]|nr:ABC transporter substrate-binding protein [Acidimicrobiales bacterium]